MAITDTRFTSEEKALLASLIGRRFEKYRVDERISDDDATAFGVVGLFVDGHIFALSAKQEAREFFESREDIAVVSFSESDAAGIGAHLIGVKQVDRTVGMPIEDVLLYEDRHALKFDGETAFEYLWTSAIVFKLPHTEVVIEPDGWIMESFTVTRGPGASKSIRPADSDIDDEAQGHVEASRRITSLASWLAH